MGQSEPFLDQLKSHSCSTMVVAGNDDEQRALAATLFEEVGFNVIECASGEAAAAAIDVQRDEIAMIFTDIALSGRMDGVDLARVASNKAPGALVIVTSGASGGRLQDLPETTEYMRKPWRALDLLIRAERVRADHLTWRGDIL